MFQSLSFNNLLAQQLTAATIAILAISAVVIVAMLTFRCYMLYYRTYDNTVTYQPPAYRPPRAQHINLDRKRRPRLFFWRKKRNQNAASDRTSYSFQTIFEDPGTEP